MRKTMIRSVLIAASAFVTGGALAQNVPMKMINTDISAAISSMRGAAVRGNIAPAEKRLLKLPAGFDPARVVLSAPANVSPLISAQSGRPAVQTAPPVPAALLQQAALLAAGGGAAAPAPSPSPSPAVVPGGNPGSSLGSGTGSAPSAQAPSGVGSSIGSRIAQPAPLPSGPTAPTSPITSQNYGAGNFNTVYHYSDSLNLTTSEYAQYPQSAVGFFLFTFDNVNWSYCTATMISNSIAVLAGHCVHDGAGNPNGFIKQGIFIPGCINCFSGYFSNNFYAPFNVAGVAGVVTTYGWYTIQSLDQGYDVALIVLNKRNGTATEIGSQTGFMKFCFSGCLWNNNYLTQLGYPGNYASGNWLYVGQHHEASDTRDYLMGSGAQGGSSGGPHVANIGTIFDSSTSAGQFPTRDVIFAVTSWGYINETIKIQGASSLSGPSDSNQFKTLFNLACNTARALHGAASCALLP